MSWMSYYFSYLNYATYFKRVQRIKHCLCLEPSVIFIYGKFHSILYIFNFCLVFKLCKSSLQILHIISDHLIFFRSVNLAGYFRGAIFWKVNFNSCSFFRYFFLTCQFYMTSLYVIPYFGHGQCSIWGFLVLAFIKGARSLTTIYFFWYFLWSGNDAFLVCKLCLSSV